jgi:hypothetical protein
MLWKDSYLLRVLHREEEKEEDEEKDEEKDVCQNVATPVHNLCEKV